MKQPTREQIFDWEERLRKLLFEMQVTYGEGELRARPEMAVDIAFYLVHEEARREREAAKFMKLD